MNKEFEKAASLVNSKPISAPTDSEIIQTIQKIEERLQIKAINRHVNSAVKEGYSKTVEILRVKETDHEIANISALKTIQGRAIAFLAIDYLKGECTQETLCNVPIKDR